jgi:5-methylcytosine-specific restriction protein A
MAIRRCIYIRGEKMRANWTRDEVILGLDVLFSVDITALTLDSTVIVDLSELLRRLPIIPAKDREEYFRNPAGVRRQLLTFAWSLKKEIKAAHVGGQFYRVYYEYKNNLDELHRIAQAIRRCESATLSMQFGDTSEANGFPEGAILSHIHRNIEGKYTEKCRDTLTECEVCGLRPTGIYVGMGNGSILGKHFLVPPTELDPEAKQDAADFITVCPNCHQSLHIIRPWRGRKDCESILI